MKHPAQPLAATAFMLLTLFATATLAADSRETRPVAGFSGIDLGVPAKLEIIQGETESLALQGPADVLADIETIVRNDGVLLIRKRTRGSWPFHTEVRIVVNAKRVESVAIAGSGDRDRFDALRVHDDADLGVEGPAAARALADEKNAIVAHDGLDVGEDVGRPLQRERFGLALDDLELRRHPEVDAGKSRDRPRLAAVGGKRGGREEGEEHECRCGEGLRWMFHRFLRGQ